MARVIEFYVPQSFKGSGKSAPEEQRGKVVEFPQRPHKKSA